MTAITMKKVLKGQVHHGDAHGQGHVDGKGFPVGLYIGGEDRYFGAGEIFVHLSLLLRRRNYSYPEEREYS